MNKKLTYSIWFILFLLYYISYRGSLSHIIFYNEQHRLFLFSKEYFLHQLHAEGLLSYLTDFLIQFFYYPTLGSLLLALLVSSVYLLVHRVIVLLAGRQDVLQLAVVPSLCLFLYTMPADNSLTLVVGTVLGLSALVLCLFLLQHCGLPLFAKRRSVATPTLKQIVITVLMLVVYATGGCYYFYTHYNRAERIMLKSEEAVKAKDWMEVLDYTERYLNSGRTNQLMLYFHNLALYHTGRMPYHLMDYPQTIGVEGLYLPWKSDSRESEYGHYLYEDLGYTNEAQRWEFEAMVVWGETAPHLLNLVHYNIVNHRPLVAQRFINKLKQSLFYREEALKLEQLRDSGEVPGVRNALAGVTDTPARFANVLNIGPELEYLCQRDSTNRMAFEYLMSDLLLSNHVVRFVKNLHFIKNFSYPAMPRVYEEALYIYKLGVSAEEFAKCGFTVSKETELRFQRYYELMRQKQMRALRAEFGNSYWFYLNYVSPYGNKVISN